MKKLVVIFLMVAGVTAYAQEKKEEPKYGIGFSGFVKTDFFYDTRQSSAANGLREGHFYLFPDNVLFDDEMKDLNANSSFHILNIQTRIKGDITGPDAFGAKTSGLIEGEFFGTSETDLNGFRLRHAFVKLDWQKTSLLIGQFWHPMFPVESFPGTISFNTGAPFTPFSRNPQVRLTSKFADCSVSLTAYGQRDFTSTGPDGSSNKYLRNSGMPGFDLLLRGPANSGFTGSAGLDFKRIRPELKTPANIETDASLNSLSAFATMKIKTNPVNISLMGVYAQNASDLVMIGGYAVTGLTDPVREIKTYTNLSNASFWADLSSNGNKVIYGLFTGYSKNLGAGNEITGAIYGRGTNVDHLFRISPRIIFTDGRLSFCGELENTIAAYGTTKPDGKVTVSNSVSNLRVLFSTIYKF